MRKIAPRIPVWRSVATMAIISFAAPAPVWAQSDPFEPSFAGEIMDGLKQGMDAVANMALFKTDFNVQIAAARKEYWSAYPNGPGLEEARAKYMEMLAAKDLVNILPSLVLGPTQGLKWAKGLDVLSSPDIWFSPNDVDAVVRLDGGVHPIAEPALKAMARAIRESAGLTPDPQSRTQLDDMLIIPSPTAANAIAANEEAIEAYLAARNRAEMYKGLQYRRFARDRDWLAARLMLEGDFESVEDAEQYLGEIDEVLGPGRVDETAAGIRRLPVNEHGELIHPEQLGPYSPAYSGIEEVSAKYLLDIDVGQGSARDYAIAMIRFDQGPSWREALDVYREYWVEPFGEKAVLAAAEQVRTAPKKQSPGSGYLAEQIRYTNNPRQAMRRLMPYDPYRDYPLGSLTADDPKEYLYAVLRNFGSVQYWNEVPTAYEELEQRWGRTLLDEAIGRLMAVRKNTDGTLAAPADLGVSSGNPATALAELLQQGATTPRGYFADLFMAESNDGAREYEALRTCFGQEHLDDVINKVREAQEQHVDLKTLEGAVSGFDEPAQAILDILWATSTPEQCYHYMIWRRAASHYSHIANRELDLKTAEAEVQEKIDDELEIYGREAAYAAAAKIAAAPKMPFTLHEYYYRDAPKLADPKAIDPELIMGPGEVDRLLDFVAANRLAGIIKRRTKPPAPGTALQVGDEFELQFQGDWRRTKVLQVRSSVSGLSYLIQVDFPDVQPLWVSEFGLKRSTRPIQNASTDSTETDPTGKGGSRGGEGTGDDTAEGETGFPVGSKVKVRFNNRLWDAVVLEHRVQNGYESYLVEYEDRGRKIERWFNAKWVEAPEDAPPAEEEGGGFPVGAKVKARINNQMWDAKVLEHRVRDGVDSYLVEYEYRRGRTSTVWLKAEDVLPPEA